MVSLDCASEFFNMNFQEIAAEQTAETPYKLDETEVCNGRYVNFLTLETSLGNIESLMRFST